MSWNNNRKAEKVAFIHKLLQTLERSELNYVGEIYLK